MEPVAFMFVGSPQQLEAAFDRAGWSLADTPSFSVPEACPAVTCWRARCSGGGAERRLDMRRAITGAVLVMLALAGPAGAMMKSDKDAKHQCRVEYNEAKRKAGELKTRRERVDAKRDAKKKYDECLENAKHKS